MFAAAIGCDSGDSTADQAAQSPATISVAAAANLKFAFEHIVAEFERQHPEITVRVTYGSSGSLFAQVSQRAPFDIFFSADTRYPQQLVEQNFAEKDAYFVYTTGRLAVWTSKQSPIDITTQDLTCIADPSVRKIAIANPRLAPYGTAAVEALQNLGIYDDVKDRLVYGENITQAAHFVETGAADVGIIAVSLTIQQPGDQQPDDRQGRLQEIPADLHSPIRQAAVITATCTHPDAVRQLRQFILSDSGQKILSQFGYRSPQE
jgi:molybdate transport system substrate-binding protein